MCNTLLLSFLGVMGSASQDKYTSHGWMSLMVPTPPQAQLWLNIKNICQLYENRGTCSPNWNCAHEDIDFTSPSLHSVGSMV
mmetsp:Transcript_32460/g.58219  ORF Transcript_32460/g.58219 Transcript_32460/m.58219 type:complete len:82 (-) Transcript_32460:178-423(-)